MSKQTDAANEVDELIAQVDDLDEALAEFISNTNMTLLNHGSRITALEKGTVTPPPIEPPPIEPPPTGELGPLDYEFLFEGSSTGLANSGNPVVTSKVDARQGNGCMVAHLKEGMSNAKRAEGVIPGNAKFMRQGTHYWFGGSIKLVGPWQAEQKMELCWQCHSNASTGTPPLALHMGQGYWRFSVRSSNGQKQYDLMDIHDNAVNQWMDYVVHYYPMNDNTGLTEFWINGVKYVTHQGPNVKYAQDEPYCKWGIYKVLEQGNIKEREVRHDCIRIASGPKAKYADVDPRSYD